MLFSSYVPDVIPSQKLFLLLKKRFTRVQCPLLMQLGTEVFQFLEFFGL